MINQPPNPRLQRTRAAHSPLSRQPLGDFPKVALVFGVLVVASAIQARGLQEPDYALKGYDILPKTVPLSQEHILIMLVPDYEEKVRSSKEKMADPTDSNAWWHTYEAAIVAFRRTNLGIRGEDFLIVAIQEIDEPCHGCRRSIFGGVDLKRQVSMGSFRSTGASSPDASSVVLIKSGSPWRLRFKYGFQGAGGGGVDWERPATVSRDSSQRWLINFGEEHGRNIRGVD